MLASMGKDPGADLASAMLPLNVPPAAIAANTAPPVVHVSNQIHVARDGSTTVRTDTPSGLRISRPMEAA